MNTDRDKKRLYLRSWRAKNPGKEKAYSKKYARWKQEDSKNYMKQYFKSYYEENAELIKMRARTWRRDNPERARQSDKRKYLANRSRHHEQGKQWTKRNPEKRKAILLRYGVERSKRIADCSDGSVTYQAVAELFEQFTHCPYCGIDLLPSIRHLDHKEPLSRGGLHTLANVIPCCKSCNIKKSNMPYAAWLERMA